MSNSLSGNELVSALREALDPVVLTQIDRLLAGPVLPPLPGADEVSHLIEQETERRIRAAASARVLLEGSESVIAKVSEAAGERAAEAHSSATRDVCETGNLVILAHIFRNPDLGKAYKDLIQTVLDPEGALGVLGADSL